MSARETKTQVAIVGAGPVGVALAIALGQHGVHCVLIERRRDIQKIPKGQNLTQRTFEHFHFFGLAEDLRAARTMPRDFPTGDVLAYRSLNSDHWRVSPGRAQVNPFFFLENDRIPQYRTEAVLRRELESLDTAHARFGCAALSIVQDERRVRLTIQREGDAATEIIEADYLVGCDGARSIVREQVAIARGGRNYNKLMVLGVFRSPELNEGLKRFPTASLYRVLHPELQGFWRFLGRVEPDSFFYHAPVPESTDRQTFDLSRELSHCAGFPVRCDAEYLGFWDAQISVARDYRVGRVFIAGDAAHSHPPYGGYGLNNGLEDAVNLGWKLRAVLTGWGGDRLLDSYSAERRPIFQETADDFINAPLDEEAAFLARYNPERDREEFEKAWKALDGFSGSPSRRYEPHYEGSPIVLGPPGAKSSAHGEHMLKARIGHHLAPQKLSRGRDVYEELRPEMTLLAFGADPADVARLKEAARRRRIPLDVIEDTFADGRMRYEAKLILVRPDQYVAWAGNAVHGDVDGIVATASGQM